ncbi:MAG: DUF3575 domain-containing protein [Rikenellaceae bacterium]
MKKITSILTLLLLYTTAYSHTEHHSQQVEILFDFNSYAINLDLNQNQRAFNELSELITNLLNDSLVTVTKVEINSYASPEGERRLNERLSSNRSQSLYNYLRDTIAIPDSLIEINNIGSDWDQLYYLVSQSQMDEKDDVLDIITNIPEETWRRVNPNDRWLTMVDSRNKHLMDLHGGVTYNYMFENIYPKLRRGTVVTIYFKSTAPAVAGVIPQTTSSYATQQMVTQISSEDTCELNITTSKPIIALKTNLLFDIMTLINFELEVYINKNWSICGEWIFPWWSSSSKESSKRNCIQLLNGNIEGKYWFASHPQRPVMTGWFAGVYAGGGLYDLEYHKEGYQGEFFIALGLSGGYAHTINKRGNLRMEYSLGVGVLKSDYRHYEEHWGIDSSWHTIRKTDGTYTWFGPTKAKASLVWLINKTIK